MDGLEGVDALWAAVRHPWALSRGRGKMISGLREIWLRYFEEVLRKRNWKEVLGRGGWGAWKSRGRLLPCRLTEPD